MNRTTSDGGNDEEMGRCGELGDTAATAGASTSAAPPQPRRWKSEEGGVAARSSCRPQAIPIAIYDPSFDPTDRGVEQLP